MNSLIFGNNFQSASLALKALLTLSTSLLLILIFPNHNQSWLVWIALVPLSIACSGSGIFLSLTLGLLSGSVAAFGTFIWIFEVSGFRWYHFLILGSYLGLYTAFWCSALSILNRRRYVSVIAVPALWCALDYVKAHAGFLAFPWGSLAHSQHDNLQLIQLSSYTGEYGVTFLIVMTNYVIAMSILYKTWRLLIVPGVFLVVVNSWGMLTVTSNSVGRQLKVAVVQPNFLRHERKTEKASESSVDRLAALTISSASAYPELVVWPETAVKSLETNTALLERVRRIANKIDAPIITGSSEVLKFAERSEQQSGVQFNNRVHNSAYFISPDGTLMEPYRKIRLVPFVEYTPEIPLIQWPDWLVYDSFNITPGDSFKHFPLGEGYRVSPIICWENIFADHITALVSEGSDLIVQLTNDNRFGRTAAPYQHNAASVFRAVENRVPIVIASNTGPSQIIDSFGRIVAEVPYLSDEGGTTAALSLRKDESKTFYTRNGDLFARICIAIALIGIIDGCFIRTKSDTYSPGIFKRESSGYRSR